MSTKNDHNKSYLCSSGARVFSSTKCSKMQKNDHNKSCVPPAPVPPVHSVLKYRKKCDLGDNALFALKAKINVF